MSARTARSSRMAGLLLRHAAWLCPPERAEWFCAMRNEFEHLPDRGPALSWALGCLLVSYQERIAMMTGSFKRIPRWLLSLEIAVCLVPVTWLFVSVLAMTARGAMPLGAGLLLGSASLLGPVAAVAAVRILTPSGGPVGRTTATVMALLAAWTVLVCAAQVTGTAAPWSNWWRDLALLGLLPAWAVVHLLQVSAARSARTATAAPTR